MNKNKIIGIALILTAIIIVILCIHDRLTVPGKKEEPTINQTIPEETENNWDGESVEIDMAINYDLGTCGLNEEVLSKIDYDTSAMSENMQLYLISQYDIGNVEKVIWDGIAILDYTGKKIELTFDIIADEECVVQCIYDQYSKEWSFYKL